MPDFIEEKDAVFDANGDRVPHSRQPAKPAGIPGRDSGLVVSGCYLADVPETPHRPLLLGSNRDAVGGPAGEVPCEIDDDFGPPKYVRG